ncbi:S-methyl-5-thioribose-1-phosphate isomerase [Christensenella timonensis]|uniref:S-methyl-5-thioribose-1-phosphate isomerase n=1 Tax=Christensenella timonensis TaxID=1816678 RepID=UPI00082ABA6E|nr:S-methyl-5-thioribose-1-phosphate isomerase [Christensenella timonensis]
MKQSIMEYDTVALDDENSALVIIDQTQLPYNTEILHLKDQKSIWDAIYLLQVRGAPAIGVAAGIAIYLAAKEIDADNFDDFYKQFVKAKDYLDSARPTAVNLSWALKRMDDVVRANKDKSIAEIKEILHKEAVKIKEEDTWVCKTIGEYGLSLLKPGMGLLTHCNAGQLATSKYGTATAPMYLGHEKGYNFRVFCDETRPLLQGARLTSYELQESGIDTTLICDNMAPSVMKKGWVDAVFVGCDRVAKNGDTANKIGTSYVALAAKYYGIPFYVCAPTSTIDMNCASGDDIHIELRSAEEVTEMWYEKRMAPEGVKVFNPAFDVTDAQNITGIITEYGIAYAPFEESLKEIFAKKETAAKK